MAKTVEQTDKDEEVVQEVLGELEALPAGHQMSGDEWLSFIQRLPKLNLPDGWTSADDIREFRGPLPEDDPEFQRNILGRR